MARSRSGELDTSQHRVSGNFENPVWRVRLVAYEQAVDGRDPIRVELDPSHARGYAAIVLLCGEHDIATSPEIALALAPIRGDLLIDLSGCEFIDSTVVAALLEKFEDLRREGHRLELLVPPEQKNVRRVIDVVGLGTLMTVLDAVPGAGSPGLPDDAALGA